MRKLRVYLDTSIFGGVFDQEFAAASVAGADLMLSWNFKHIVRYDRIRKFNGVNALKGYSALDIRSPLEVQNGENEEGL